MSDDVEEQTQPNAEHETAENSPEHLISSLLDQIRPYTICYIVSAIPIAIGGFIGIGSDHWKIGLIFTGIGIILIIIGLVLHLRTRRSRQPRGKGMGIQWNVIIPIFTPSLVMIILVVLTGVVAKCAYERGREIGKASFIPATPTNATRELPNGRILLVDVTPEYLTFLFREHTHTEALKRMEPYWNKWIIFSGPVANLKNYSDKDTWLMIERPDPFGFASGTLTDPKQIERAQPLLKGNPVTLLCKIAKSSNEVSLTDCELQ